MERICFLMIFILCSVASADTEWVLTLTGLPEHTGESPDAFTVHLIWQQGPKSEFKNVSLNLKKSEAGLPALLLQKVDDKSFSVQPQTNMKPTTFYQDLNNMGSISLTNHNGKTNSLKGSFLLDEEIYEIQPYNRKIHKRITSAREGDHIITKRKTADSSMTIDSASILKSERFKRQIVADDTTYTVQLCIVVDFYLYQTLNESSREINWPGGVISYIQFVMGHMANEVDIRYRSIDSSEVSASWTIGTKLSYLLIAGTGETSPSPYPRDTGLIDSDKLLKTFQKWVKDKSDILPDDVDHYMLVTSLDLTEGGSRFTNGRSFIAGACGAHKTSIAEFGSSEILARQLGYSLGAREDGQGNDCSSSDQFVMTSSSTLTNSSTRGNPWKFSPCSIGYFDSFLTTLNSESSNCLTNPGSHIGSWADHQVERIGQTIPVDEQCRWNHGNDFAFPYSISAFSNICQALWCTKDGRNLVVKAAALQYTTCGNRKWCVEEECVSNPAAPQMDEKCPFGDARGTLFSRSDLTCDTVTAVDCATSAIIVEKCCSTCSKFEKPWLGPDCLYGDKHVACENIRLGNCPSHAKVCCDSCCSTVGPAEGYSCASTELNSPSAKVPTTATTSIPAAATTTTPTTITTTPTSTSTVTLVTTTQGSSTMDTTSNLSVTASTALTKCRKIGQASCNCNLDGSAGCSLIKNSECLSKKGKFACYCRKGFRPKNRKTKCKRRRSFG